MEKCLGPHLSHHLRVMGSQDTGSTSKMSAMVKDTEDCLHRFTKKMKIATLKKKNYTFDKSIKKSN